jgi:hypothetical protein
MFLFYTCTGLRHDYAPAGHSEQSEFGAGIKAILLLLVPQLLFPFRGKTLLHFLYIKLSFLFRAPLV